MDSLELVRASRKLASRNTSQEALRRAVSTAYYAMFHALAASNADLIVGTRTPTNQSEWTTTYRSLRHLRAQNPLYGWPYFFSGLIQEFAFVISGIKDESENADYNPVAYFSLEEIMDWIDRAEKAIADFRASSAQERSMVAIATLAGQR